MTTDDNHNDSNESATNESATNDPTTEEIITAKNYSEFIGQAYAHMMHDKEFLAYLFKALDHNKALRLEDLPPTQVISPNDSFSVQLTHYQMGEVEGEEGATYPAFMPRINITAQDTAGISHGIAVHPLDFALGLITFLSEHPTYTDWIITMLGEIGRAKVILDTINDMTDTSNRDIDPPNSN